MTLKGSRTVRRGAVGKVSGLINLENSLAAYSTEQRCANLNGRSYVKRFFKCQHTVRRKFQQVIFAVKVLKKISKNNKLHIIIIMKAQHKFNIGDSVIVKANVKDPDYDIKIEGWQGRVTEIIDS